MVASPFRLRVADTKWLLPVAATTGVLIGTDPHSMSLEHINSNDMHRAAKLSDGTLGVLGAVPAGMFLWGSVAYGPQARETGLLAGESVGDALIFTEAGKAIFRRDRPTVANGQGSFFSSSFRDSSFPSEHSTAAWAIASLIGDEYRGWLPRTVVYTLAATTSVSRVVAEKHFPSDVLVGGVLGWLVGHYVYRAHHQYDLTPWEEPPSASKSVVTIQPGQKNATGAPVSGQDPGAQPAAPVIAQAQPTSPQTSAESTSTSAQAKTAAAGTTTKPAFPVRRESVYGVEDDDPDTFGSANVPMDSWVYPALERLGAMGFVPSQSVAIRPWTRVECERQVAEASDLVAGNDPAGQYFSEGQIKEATRLLDGLRREFEGRVKAHESLSLESTYVRYGNIAGPALTDSYHFGQTWWNDFGRPLARGGSSVFGISGYATEGRLFFYAREEMQQGAGRPATSASIEDLIATLDRNPVQQQGATPGFVRSRPIEMYAGVAFEGNALSFGKQELFWGPTTMGPLMFSSNAEPTYNLRFVSTRPHPLPIFPNLGTYRFDIVLGKLSGHDIDTPTAPARPWYNAEKANFNFGQDLELSFTRWSILWGVGHPMTLKSFLRNLYNFTSADLPGANPRTYPGAYDSGFDFRYRLPWLSRAVTLYADGYANDDPNPIDAPRRAMWNPGIYFARLPGLPHMDLRVEAVSSEQLAADLGGNFYYYKNYYHDESTNKGFLLGNAIGRDSRAEEGRIGWWFSAQTRVEAGYRQNKGGTQFLSGGSTITDGFINARVQLSQHWSAQMFGQYERFLIPQYMAGAQSNRSAWFQMTWTPEIETRK